MQIFTKERSRKFSSLGGNYIFTLKSQSKFSLWGVYRFLHWKVKRNFRLLVGSPQYKNLVDPFWRKFRLIFDCKSLVCPLKCHTKTVRNKRCKLKVIYLNKFLLNCNVNSIKLSGFFQSFLKNYFFCILSVFHEFWLKWS